MLNIRNIGSNQTELSFSGGRILFSYSTPVAFISSDYSVVCKTSKKWSKTTSKHINLYTSHYTNVEEKPQEWFDSLVSQFDMKGVS